MVCVLAGASWSVPWWGLLGLCLGEEKKNTSDRDSRISFFFLAPAGRPRYGVGIWLYFKDVKRLALIFFWMAVVATPAVLCNVSVNSEPKEGGAPANFLFTMMG